MNDEHQDPIAAGFQSRADFEAALPLYVGGDLTPEESRRVEIWAEEHPEDEGALAAAVAAHGLLVAHAEDMRSLDGPDLWPSVRAQLRSERIVGSGEAPAPVLRSNRRWYAGRALAAAAALVLCGGLAGILALGSGPEQVGDVSDGAGVTFTGTEGRPAAVRFANAKEPVIADPEGLALRPTGGEAEHLVERAIPLPGRQAIPTVWRAIPGDQGLQLTSGRR